LSALWGSSLRQLKVVNKNKYGIHYQGSKTKIIGDIAKFFPNADHFYDLFGGGFSVTHYMLKHRSKSYKHFHLNEIRTGICELVKDAISGKYSYQVFKPEWIDRDRFTRDKESNAYIKIIWSFGNNGKNYLFGKDIESEKRSMHQAVVFDEFDDFMKNTVKLDKWPNSLDITGKRLYLRMQLRKIERIDLQRLQRLEQLERLQQLQRLEQLQQLQRLVFTTLDYRQVKVEPNSIIYCDIPYQGAASYGSEFSHIDFFDWADSQDNPVFISEYKVNDDRFHLLKQFKHRTKFLNGVNNAVTECLYGNKLAHEIIQKARKVS
jgi:site-specific DNA-adenine methylase